MLVLLDACVPQPLRAYIAGHTIETAAFRGWAHLKNGALLAQMRAEGFHCLLTVDANLQHQQNLLKAGIAVIVLRAKSNTLDSLIPLVPKIVSALSTIQPGEVVELS